MSKPVRIGSTKCQPCTEIININARKRVANDIKNGICLDCDNKVYESQRYCEAHRARNNERSKDKREAHKTLGLCILCVKSKAGHSDVCTEHYLKRAAKKHLGTSGKWSILSESLSVQNTKCFYCNTVLELGLNTEIDHKNPISRFPEQAKDPKNIVWACKPCNQAKNDLTAIEFIALCQRVINGYNNR
jgi:5-methylcytosine-specific restriction endonuclease McrA